MIDHLFSALRSLLALALLVMGVSCMGLDVKYYTLESAVETAPNPDAIVGMWHRRSTDGLGTLGRESYLFNRDGTGLCTYYISDTFSGPQDTVWHFKWSYAGDGIWQQRYADSDATAELRISKGTLLLKGSIGSRTVLERVPPL